MGRRATDLATPVPVLGVPALVGLRGYKTLAGEKIAGPPPLPALSWTQQCSIGVQTSPGVGRLPLLQPGAKQPASTLFTASPDNSIDALDCFVAKELKEEGILQQTQGDRHQQRCVEAKTRKEVTFQEIPAGTSEHREGSQGHNKVDCYARAIKTNPHLAGTLTKGGPKPKLNLRYTNGSVVDSDAIGGISVEGGDARPEKDGALGREQGKAGGGHCVEQSGEGASVTVVQPFRTPPKICNQCGGKQTAPCGPDIMGWQKPTGACPEGVPLNPGTLPPSTAATPTTPTTPTTAATDMGKLRDFQVCHPQLPQRMPTCMAQRPSLAGRPPLICPNAGLKPKTPHPSCPVHSAHAIPQGHPVASAQPQTPTQLPGVLPTQALTVTEAIIETRQHDANSNSLETQPHTNKPSLPACISLPPQFAIATKANTPYGCSYRKWTETSSCTAARYSAPADGGTAHTAPSNTQLPAAAREGPRSHRPSPAGPENTPHTVTTSTSTNTLRTDCNTNTYTKGLRGPSTVSDSITVKNKNMKNQACSDSSRNPTNLAKPLSKASLEMVMNTKNNAKTAMRPKTFPGSILHLATTQVMDTLSSYEQNNTSLPVGTHMHIQAPTHTASHATTIAKTTPDSAIKPFRRVETPRETNPSNSRTDDVPKPTSDHYRAEPMGSLCPKPSPVTPESPIHTTSSGDVFSTSSPSKAIPLEESSSPCAVSPAASPELIEKPRSGHPSHDAPPHMSSDGGHLTHVLNLDRPSRADTAPPAQTSPGAQTHSHNGPALENAGAIHHGAPASTSQGPGGAEVRPQEPLASSEKTRLAGDVPNPSQTRKTNAQHLHRFPPNLLKNMAALTVSEECVSNHAYTVSTIRRETKVNSIIKSCFDPNKDHYKCIDTPEKQNSKPHQNSIFLKVTHHLNYISRIKPQRCQLQTSMNTNKQQFFPLQGHTDRMKQVQTGPPAPQVRPSEEIQHPTTTEPCLLDGPARGDLETGAIGEAHSPCSTSPTATPTDPRHRTALEDATADSSFDDSTGELSGQRFLDSDTLSSQLTCTHSSASSPLSRSTLDTSGDRELCPRSPTGPTCGVRLQRPWTDLTALAHLRSRGRAGQSSGHTLVHRGPEGHPPRAHAHPPDAEERLLPPSPRCSKTAALQWRLETVEASLEANRARISTLLHIIQDLEQSHASSAGCWCFRTGQDLKNCSICQRTACVVYSVEYDFRQQEKCFSVLLDHPSSEPPGHAVSSPFHQAHSITSLRDALAKRIARSRVKSKKLCKTFFKLLPRKSQQR